MSVNLPSGLPLPSSPRPGQLVAMISSTRLDLQEHRAFVKEACLTAGVFPLGMDQLPARDANGVTISLEMVDQANIYIGIYACRYGWIPDGSEISITEMEFNRALERKAAGELQEILIFIAHDSHSFTVADMEFNEVSQTKLSSFKQRASENRFRKEFVSSRDLSYLVENALQEFKSRNGPVAPSSMAAAGVVVGTRLKTTIPNNLPGLQPFFGRDAELKLIADALDPDSRIWGALIDGPGGMGKTSLAIRAAYDVSPDHFGRIIFLTLKTRELDDSGTRDLSGFILTGLQELFNELAREIGQPDIATAAEKLRPRLLLDAMRGTRTLLLLDNLESLTIQERGEILTFVKKLPSGCKAILTSRGRIGSAAEELILQKLDQEAALQTLAELATHNPALARTNEAERIALYTQTGGKPLLLRWTAGQIGRGHCLTFTDAIAYLRSCPQGNDPLEFTFGDLVEDFSTSEMRVLAALTYFAQSAAVKHVAAVAGLADEGVCLQALKSLVNRSLAVPSDELQTFALVPMVADFVRQHRPDVVLQAGERLEKQAYTLIEENGFQEYSSFPVLDAAWESIAPALPLFVAGQNEQLQEVCTALAVFLEYTGRWDERLSLVLQAEAKALASGDLENAAWRSYEAGMVHADRGQADEVMHCAQRAMAHGLAFGKGRGMQAHAYQLQGIAHQLMGDLDSAATAFRELLNISLGISGSKRRRALALQYLGDVERLSKDFEAADESLQESLEIFREIRDPRGEAVALAFLANLRLDQESWVEAESMAREALELSMQIGRQMVIARSCRVLATALKRQSKGAESLPHARRAVEIYGNCGSAKLQEAVATLRECEEISG